MSRINKFYASFKRRGGEVFELGPDHTIVTADNRPFATRVRHGLISALAGDNLVMLNAEVALAETLYPEAGALIVGNTFKTPVIQPQEHTRERHNQQHRHSTHAHMGRGHVDELAVRWTRREEETVMLKRFIKWLLRMHADCPPDIKEELKTY